MKALLMIFVIAGNYNYFYLVPNTTLIKYAPDISLLVLFGLLGYQTFIERTDLARINTFVTWFVFCYLLLVIIQASVASFYYEQSVFDGIVVARKQFSFLAAISMMMMFKTGADIEKFMTWMSIVAAVIVYLGLVNYFGPTIFYHRWAEGQGIRSGIVRAYLPGLEILVLAFIWNLVKILSSERLSRVSLMFLLIAVFGLIFRQTKMHIIVSFLVGVLVMLYYRKFLHVFIITGTIFLGSFAFSTFTNQNIIVNIFQTAYESVFTSEESIDGGVNTWAGRMEQVDASFKTIEDTFFTGSGGVVIRGIGVDGGVSKELHLISRGMDLGYFVWVKFFGFPGILLLAGLYIYVVWQRIIATSRSSDPYFYIDNYAFFHFLIIAFSMVTIGYFNHEHAISILCICLAIIGVRAKSSRLVGQGQ